MCETTRSQTEKFTFQLISCCLSSASRLALPQPSSEEIQRAAVAWFCGAAGRVTASAGMSGYVGSPCSGCSGCSGSRHASADSFTSGEQPPPPLLLWVWVSRHPSSHPAHSAIRNTVQLPTRLFGRTPLAPTLPPKHSLMKSERRIVM